MFDYIHKVCYCASSKSSDRRYTAQIMRMSPISRRHQESQELVQSVMFCPDERKSQTPIFGFYVPDWQINVHNKHASVVSKSPNVFENVYTVFSCILLPVGNKQMSLHSVI